MKCHKHLESVKVPRGCYEYYWAESDSGAPLCSPHCTRDLFPILAFGIVRVPLYGRKEGTRFPSDWFHYQTERLELDRFLRRYEFFVFH